MEAAETVVDGVHRITAPLGERFMCAYVVTGPALTVLVDTGVASTPSETLLPAIDGLGVAPDLVIISHADFDHHGGNAPLSEAFPSARFACHPADRAQIEDPGLLVAERYGEFVPRYGVAPDPAGDRDVLAQTTAVPIDVELRGGETLDVGDGRRIDVLHVPGHSRGHLTLWDSRTATAIVADAVLGDTLRTTDGAAAFPPTYRYVDDYRASTRSIRALGARRLLTSHFPVLEGDAVDAFLDLTERFTDAVERELLRELSGAAAPPTLDELIDALAPRLGSWPAAGARFLSHPLAGHLEALQDQGRVRRIEADGGPPRFALLP
ncbi:MAG TPA: MBL fold metallo-hydrolase [Capillimicrobium sp.]|jgi:glyoxylase-like metal-dependent hydrolase (beta-lactamase superfamily II)